MTIGRYTVQTDLGPVSLATDEEFVSIERSIVIPPAVPQTPGELLCRMGGVEEMSLLGHRGPVVASAVNIENAGNPELRRYEARFGRDAFYAAEFLSELLPDLELGTVRYFGAYQADHHNPRSQAAPGKIPNHVRNPQDPLAVELTRTRGRQWPWFGGTDTTVQYLAAASRVLIRDPGRAEEPLVYPEDHGRAGELVERDGGRLDIAGSVRAAAAWLLNELDRPQAPGLLWVPMNDADSFTVWTDSPNHFHHRDGVLARPPVAPVQLQALVYDTLLALIELDGLVPGLHLDRDDLAARADRLRSVFFDLFVVESDGDPFLASALEQHAAGLRPLEVRTVSMGWVLGSRLLPVTESTSIERGLLRNLFSPEMLSPFGIVGRSRDGIRFEEFDYHAQVWAFAVYKVVQGLVRLGYHTLAANLCRRLRRQGSEGLCPENVGAAPDDDLRYCDHVLRVSRLAADGRPTITVKERPPAPNAAWTAAAFVAVEHMGIAPAERDCEADGGVKAAPPDIPPQVLGERRDLETSLVDRPQSA